MTMVDLEELKGINEELIYLGENPEQYADAIIGITYDGDHVVYSVEKFMECLKKEDMNDEEALTRQGRCTQGRRRLPTSRTTAIQGTALALCLSSRPSATRRGSRRIPLDLRRMLTSCISLSAP